MGIRLAEDERRKHGLHRKRPSPSLVLGTGGHRFLTFLLLLLLFLSTSSKQSKDDSCLGVDTNSSHHHSSRTFHDMGAWEHRGTKTDLQCLREAWLNTYKSPQEYQKHEVGV